MEDKYKREALEKSNKLKNDWCGVDQNAWDNIDLPLNANENNYTAEDYKDNSLPI